MFHVSVCVFDPYQAWLDADEVGSPLVSRGRLPGERFQPLGMEGRSMKLAEFMVNVKIPRRARANWPLVCTHEEILWVPGYRIGNAHRIRVSTKLVIKLSLLKKPD